MALMEPNSESSLLCPSYYSFLALAIIEKAKMRLTTPLFLLYFKLALLGACVPYSRWNGGAWIEWWWYDTSVVRSMADHHQRTKAPRKRKRQNIVQAPAAVYCLLSAVGRKEGKGNARIELNPIVLPRQYSTALIRLYISRPSVAQTSNEWTGK